MLRPGGEPTAFTIRPVEYHYATVRDELGAAYRVLAALAERGVGLLAFTAVPSGPELAQFALFPDDPNKLAAEARAAGLAAPSRWGRARAPGFRVPEVRAAPELPAHARWGCLAASA